MRRVTIACAAAIVALGSFTACPKKKEDATSSKRGDRASSAPTITFTVEGVEANGTKPPTDDVLQPVKTLLDAYLRRAVIEPLHSGAPAGDLADLFTVQARPRLTEEAHRATLVEEGLPPASTSISAEAAKVSLSSVAGPDGSVVLVGARVDLKLHAVGPRVDIDILRDGEMVITYDDGAWRIDSFGLRTTRNTRDKAEGGS